MHFATVRRSRSGAIELALFLCPNILYPRIRTIRQALATSFRQIYQVLNPIQLLLVLRFLTGVVASLHLEAYFSPSSVLASFFLLSPSLHLSIYPNRLSISFKFLYYAVPFRRPTQKRPPHLLLGISYECVWVTRSNLSGRTSGFNY